MMPLFGVFGGNEAAAAAFLILISTLSLGAAFLIYRAVKGKRDKSNGVNVSYRPTSESEVRAAEQDEDWRKATGRDSRCPEDCESGSSEAVILSTAGHTLTRTDIPKEDIREATHDALYKSAECPRKRYDITEENDVKCKKVVSDVNIDVLRSDLVNHYYKSNKPEKATNGNNVTKSTHGTEDIDTDQHIEVDESSETESAQENLEVKSVPVYKCQSMEDLSDNAFSTQDNVNKDCGGGEIITTGLEAQQKTTNMDDVETKHKSFGTSIEHFPEMNDLDSCNDEKSDLFSKLPYKEVVCKDGVHELTTSNINEQHLSRKYDHNFISSAEQNNQVLVSPELQSDFTAPPQILDVRKGTADSSVVVSQNKNEISIMEAIMDNNEWLSSGSADTRDPAWLTQTQSISKYGSKAQSSSPALANNSFGINANDESNQEKMTGSPVICVNNDEVLNKPVCTMLPMPQLVLLSFRVHYIINSPSQILAVTGNQQELGDWKSFVPLRNAENGFWFSTIKLPLHSEVEWKFVVVDEGKIWRWEECANRRIEVTIQEKEMYLDKNWGFLKHKEVECSRSTVGQGRNSEKPATGSMGSQGSLMHVEREGWSMWSD